MQRGQRVAASQPPLYQGAGCDLLQWLDTGHRAHSIKLSLYRAVRFQGVAMPSSQVESGREMEDIRPCRLTDVDVLGVQRSPDGVAQNEDILQEKRQQVHLYFTGRVFTFF